MVDKSSLEKLESAARPAVVVVLDVEEPIPALPYDGIHRDAWVVARVAGQPRALRVVDLASGVQVQRAQLHEMVEQCALLPVTTTHPVDDESLPFITVVVPTIAQRSGELDACLRSLSSQSYPHFEIILVDNRRTVPSLDVLSDIASRWPRLTVLRERVPGISAARNRGIAHASGEVIAFTDDDVEVAENWLRTIGSEFARHREIDVVTGLILPAELETPAQLWFEMYYGGFAGERNFEALTVQATRRHSSRIEARGDDGDVVRTVALYGAGAFGAGANMAFRASAIATLGGFDQALGTGTASRGGEDLAALMGILWGGGRIRYQPHAYVWHRHRRGYAELLTQLDGYGVGFTAALTSLVMRDPRHLLAIVRNGPLALRELVCNLRVNLRGRGRVVDATSAVREFPSEMAGREYRGYLRGPGAYVRSRREIKKRIE
ncbi:MAG: glycosyltransferase [Acidobacteria bacterium]|nr:glycosyltransferase [Acidobacteriota bacterium]